MPVIVFGLQGGRAVGSESTFDGQTMQAGIHLRWAFAPELGFPPGGFRLCRRVTDAGAKQIPLPVRLQAIEPAAGAVAPSSSNPTTP